MDDLTHSPDHLIEEALAQRPLACLPSGFVDRVVEQIQAAPVPVTRSAIRYRLELLDVAVPLFGACLVVLALGLTGHLAFLGIATPIRWPAVLPGAFRPLPAEWLSLNWLDLVGLLVFAEICFGALLCVWLWLDRPLPVQ